MLPGGVCLIPGRGKPLAASTDSVYEPHLTGADTVIGFEHGAWHLALAVARFNACLVWRSMFSPLWRPDTVRYRSSGGGKMSSAATTFNASAT